MSQPTTLNARLPGVDFVNSLREWVREQADRSERAGGGQWTSRQAATIREFDRFLAGLGPENQQLVTLLHLSEERRSIDEAQGRDRFAFFPSHKQEMIFARLGTYEGPQPPQTTLDELVFAGVHDYCSGMAATRNQVAAERERADALGAELESAQALQAETLQQGESVASELVEAREEIVELEEIVETLRRHLGDGEEPGEGKPKAKPRRTKVEGEGMTGIYTVGAPDGEVYEIGFPDSDGKQRWRRVGDDLQEAVSLRAELAGKPYEPEAVAAC